MSAVRENNPVLTAIQAAHPVLADDLPPLQAVDLAELEAMDFKPRQPLLSPWLCSQDLAMVFAPRGIGKTHFALAVAFAVATGGRFARWQAPAARKVLYLDGELPGALMQKRLLMHCPDVGPAPGYLRIFTPDLVPEGRTLPDLSTQEGQAVIDAMIEPDTALVVVDIQSVGAGQSEAGRSIGMRRGLVLRLVVLPQALRVMIPSLTNQYLSLIKNSSLAVAIGYPDIVGVLNTTITQTGQAIEGILIVMAVYLSMSLSVSLFMNWYNGRMALVER
jgi:hypothetical protein